MKKILICLTNFYPHIGGLERYVEELFSRMAQKGYEIHILALDNNNPRYELYRGLNIYRINKIITISDVFALPDIIKWNACIKELISKHKFDIISTQTRFFFTSYLGMLIAKKYNIKHVHTEHGGGFVFHRSPVIKYGAYIVDLTLGLNTLNKADIVTGVSNQVKKFIEGFSRKKVIVLHNGIDTNFWAPERASNIPVELENWINNRKLFIYMGRIIEAKGWKLLVDSIVKLSSDIRDKSAFIFAGTGPDENELINSIKKLKLNNYIKYIGSQDQKTIRNLLNKGIYINPSFSGSEGLQTTLLESGAMNSWIITTNVSGAEEVILNNKIGVIIEQKNSTQLVNAIENTVIFSPVSEARSFIIKNYSWDIIVEKYIKIL